MGCQEPHLMNLNGPLVAFLDMASSVFKRLRGCGHRCSTDINYIVRYLDSYFCAFSYGENCALPNEA